MSDAINYSSNDWRILKEKLLTDKNSAMDMLAAIDCTVQKADHLRGRIQYINDLIAQEQAALRRLLTAR